MGAYSSELITPERKRISERLKRLLNRNTMAYKTYVRPWPLTPGCKHSQRLCTYKCKNFRFLAIFSKFSAVRPLQTLTVNSPLGALQVWKILWTWTTKRRWTIRLKKMEFLRSAYKSHIRPLVIRKIGRISKKENKLANLRYLGYITANLHNNIPSSCWEQFTSLQIDPNLCSDKFADFCDSPKIFSCNPRQIFRINSPWGA